MGIVLFVDLDFGFGFAQNPAERIDLLHKITKNAPLSKSKP